MLIGMALLEVKTLLSLTGLELAFCINPSLIYLTVSQVLKKDFLLTPSSVDQVSLKLER